MYLTQGEKSHIFHLNPFFFTRIFGDALSTTLIDYRIHQASNIYVARWFARPSRRISTRARFVEQNQSARNGALGRTDVHIPPC